MKFLKVDIYNFRILRDITVKFSTDEKKKLSVIRAQNDSGKTTLLTALQWVLYGEPALPNKGVNFRLHPIDWDSEKSTLAEIGVALDFESYEYQKIGKALHKKTRVFKIKRTVEERLEGLTWDRYNEKVTLSERINGKFKQLLNFETILENTLPLELREVFFTDGDRALSFIEAGTTSQRKQVESAVKSLLGLSILENGVTHLKRQSKKFEKEVQKVSKSSSIKKICSEVGEVESKISHIDPKLISQNLKLEKIESRLHIVEATIIDSLKQGDKEDIRKRILAVKRDIREIKLKKEKLEISHCNLFKNNQLPLTLVAPLISKADSLVKGLLNKESLPAMTVSVMQQLIKDKKLCLCGETLDSKDKDGKKRIEHIQKVVSEALEQNATSKELAEINVVIKNLLATSHGTKELWKAKVLSIHEETLKLHDEAERKMHEERNISNKLLSMKDINVSHYMKEKNDLHHQRDKLRLSVDRLSRDLSTLKNRLNSLEREKNHLIRNEKINLKVVSNFEASQDILTVFLLTYSSIMDEQLEKVSETMNNYFMEMISGGGINKNAIIVNAEITKQFDIKVYGPGKRSLDPDKDLNGASRRALTLSLILALTTVSGVEAPNIIDTPLGMMAGHVKQYVTERVIEYSAQPILFLTRSEISGCEAILEKYTGAITTFSNPSHYPNSLKNDLLSQKGQIVTCKCSHTEYCNICERVGDANNPQLEERAA